MSATGSSSSSSQQGSSGGQEFVVRIPKQNKKRYHVMRFGAALNVDVSKWTQARMERENNIKEYKAEEELPKYGAGSEFGREQREESRRKKYGIAIKKYNPDDQPWQLKVHQGKNGKKYRGIREGGITENTSYYVFTQAPDGAFEASPVEEWYNFTPIQRYKHLSAEEAEEAFGKRDKVLNYFSIMLKKRLQNNDNPEEDEEEKKKKGSKNKKKGGDFKISDMDEWLTDSEQEEDEDEEPKDSDDDKSNKKDKGKKGQEKKKKKKSQDSDEEAVEESDEGDFDTREVDYITSSSSSEEEPEEEKANREMKGVEDEEALRKLDQSEDEEEEEKEENKETNEGEEATEEKAAEAKPKHKAEKADGSSGDSSSDSSDSDFDDSKCQSAVFMQKPRKKNGSDNSASSSRANTPTKMLAQKSAQKRKADAASTSNKKAKTEGSSAGGPSASTEGITEEAVRRYLMRKPMTTTELLQKFKSKKTGLSGNQLVTTIAQILKRLNPEKQTIKQKLYLSIKPDGS